MSKIPDLIARLEMDNSELRFEDEVWASCQNMREGSPFRPYHITYGDLSGLINELKHLTDVQKVTP